MASKIKIRVSEFIQSEPSLSYIIIQRSSDLPPNTTFTNPQPISSVSKMALWYRRLKGIGFDMAASSSLRSKIIVPKPPVSKVTCTWNYPPQIVNRSSHFRSYHVDRPHVRVKRPPILIAALIITGIGGIVYFRNVESVPYTKRKRFLLLSVEDERILGRSKFLKKKAEFEGKIVPEMDPESVRVKLILKDVVIALQKGLKKEAAADSQSKGVELGDLKVKMRVASDSKQVKLASSHLEGLNWEVVVVKDDAVFGCCLPGGKLIVFTGLLDLFDTNEEIATVIANEVAHVVARHHAEWFTWRLRRLPMMKILHKYLSPEHFEKSRFYQQEVRASGRMVVEAEYIGLMLTASAGYDPRVAPKVFEKMRQAWSDSSYKNYALTHPWGKATSKLVYEARLMQKEISIYEEAIAS